MAGVEERLDRDGRFVVEQDDQFLADMDERNLLIRDGGEIELDLLVVTEIDGHRLIGERLGQLEYSNWNSAV
ncbi:hypothetical protein ES703_90565 [subsurface metagenome]